MSVINTHRVSVVSKFLAPTNHRGARVKVKRSDHRSGDVCLTVSWDYALGTSENHAEAIRQYIELMDWDQGDWVVGSTDDGMVAVNVPKGVQS